MLKGDKNENLEEVVADCFSIGGYCCCNRVFSSEGHRVFEPLKDYRWSSSKTGGITGLGTESFDTFEDNG